ncbi:hypothetical protein [Nostoc sp.]|uniref:hypothetical protein n=1 Tax=Nostoc sp. TaxID=1180 RepID=UPI002FF64210
MILNGRVGSSPSTPTKNLKCQKTSIEGVGGLYLIIDELAHKVVCWLWWLILVMLTVAVGCDSDRFNPTSQQRQLPSP